MNHYRQLLAGLFLAGMSMACSNDAEKITVNDTTIVDSTTVVDTTIVKDTDDGNTPPNGDGADSSPNDVNLTQDYSNHQYRISASLPASWLSLESPFSDQSSLGINIFPKGRGIESKTPLNVHADASYSYVAIWPKGYGTEFPSGASKTFQEANASLQTQFAIDKKNSRIFYLKNGTPWAYFIVPAQPPNSWNNGFVFAQMGVNNFSATCYDKTTGAKKSASNCDPLSGDRVVRQGNVKPGDAQVIKKILASMQLNKTAAQTPIHDMIRIDKPLPNIDVTSPLTIKGKARGFWYSEGSFPVTLYDANNKRLARGVAKADGKWMTEDFVPFTLSLKFDAPDDERGKLVFERANPSGLNENARSYSIPVIFPPKDKI